MKYKIWIGCLWILCAGISGAQSFDQIITSDLYIQDYSSLFSDRAKVFATDSLKRFEKRTGSQVNFLTIPTIPNDEDIFDFSMKVAEKRKIGQEKEDNGVFVIITTQGKREFKIYPGRGMEAVLTDIGINSFFRKKVRPLLVEGNYDAVLLETIRFICLSSEGEFVASKENPRGEKLGPLEIAIVFGILFLLFIVMKLLSKFSRHLNHPIDAKNSINKTKTDNSWLWLLPLIMSSGSSNRKSGGFGGGSGGFGGFSGGGGSFGGGGGGGSW